MPLVILALALAPVIAIIFIIYQHDKFEKEPRGMLVKAFLFGLASTVPAVLLEKLAEWMLGSYTPEETLTRLSIRSFIGIALIEEYCKFFFLKRFFFKSEHFNEPYDGIMYSVMISMGFAGLENVFYVIEGGMHVALLRMFTAVPAHGIFAVVMGYFVGMARFRSEKQNSLLISGLVVATLFHGAYDFFLLAQNIPGMFIGAGISLVVGVYYSVKAIKMHNLNSPFKSQ